MKKALKSLFIVLALVFVSTALTGCGESKGIVGSWKYKGSLDYVYTFNEDGTGNYAYAGVPMEFTYTTEDNKISITYTGNTAPFETEYSIDGNELNIKDSLGKDTIYTRTK